MLAFWGNIEALTAANCTLLAKISYIILGIMDIFKSIIGDFWSTAQKHNA